MFSGVAWPIKSQSNSRYSPIFSFSLHLGTSLYKAISLDWNLSCSSVDSVVDGGGMDVLVGDCGSDIVVGATVVVKYLCLSVSVASLDWICFTATRITAPTITSPSTAMPAQATTFFFFLPCNSCNWPGVEGAGGGSTVSPSC